MKNIIFTLCLAILAFNVVAQQDTLRKKQLNELEVTATSYKNKSLLNQPTSIVKMEAKELNQQTGLYLDDAINTNVPGVQMQRRTVSGGQQINIRGYGNGVGFKGANNNFDSRGTKVYLNGIPLTDAEGITVLDDIDFSSINKVEIAKGPSGTLYGLAIAGVLNLQTQKAAQDKTSISNDFMVGSYGLLRNTTRLEIGTKKSSLMVNYGHQEYDGFMPHTASHKDFVNLMGDVQINGKQKITTYLGFSDSYDERNGELTIKQYDTLNYSGNARYIKNDAHSAMRTVRAGFGHQYQFSDKVSNNTTIFGSSQSQDNSSAGGWNDKNPLSYGFRSVFNFDFNLSEKVEITGITGIDYQKTASVNNGYRMGADSTNLSGYNVITQLKSIQATSSRNDNYFTQWTLALPQDWSITAGVGISNMKLRLDDRLWGVNNNTANATAPKFYEHSYKNLVSPNVAVNKKINNTMSAYVAYSVGYKAPVSSNFYIPTTGQVNTGLTPEKGAQIEIGTKGTLLNNRLFYTAAWFSTQFTNKITSVTVQNADHSATLYSYLVNGGSLDNKGFEFLVKYDAIKNSNGFITRFSPFANATISNFHYRDYHYDAVDFHGNVSYNDYSNNTVAGVPPVVFNLGANVETKVGFYANATYNYRDAMYFTSDMANKTNSYNLLNAKVGFKKSVEHFDFNLFAGANNITGTQYYKMVFVNQLSDAYIPAPNEINFFGGLNVKYNF